MRGGPYPGPWPAVALAASLAAAACGGDSGSPSVPPAPAPPPAPTPDPAPAPDLLLPDDPSAVLLEVWVHGGLLPPAYSLSFPPIYWLTAGGALYSEAPAPPVAPPPLLTGLRETSLTSEQLDTTLDEIVASGLPAVASEERLEPTSAVPEVLTVEFVFRDTAGAHVIRVDGLREPHTDPRVPHLRALLDLFEEASVNSTLYVGDRLQVITIFDTPPLGPADRDERPWPLPDAPQRDDDRDFSCRVFEGAVAAGLIETFATASEWTRWLLGEERFELLARPLLPGEEGCRGLRA